MALDEVVVVGYGTSVKKIWQALFLVLNWMILR